MVFAFKTIRSVALAFAYLDKKAMFLLHQGVDESTFDKIAKAKWSIEAWKTQTFFKGVDYMERVHLQTLWVEIKAAHMKEGKKILIIFHNYF